MMHTEKARTAAIATAVVTLLGLGHVLGDGQDRQDLPSRVKRLEHRVAKLEAMNGIANPAPLAETAPVRRELVAPVAIANKRFTRSAMKDSIWWDARYDFAKLERDARAIRGVLELRDMFDVLHLQVRATITDPVDAGGSHFSHGVGIDHNPNRDAHDWVRDTDPKDMQVVFRVEQVIYADGSRERFK